MCPVVLYVHTMKASWLMNPHHTLSALCWCLSSSYTCTCMHVCTLKHSSSILDWLKLSAGLLNLFTWFCDIYSACTRRLPQSPSQYVVYDDCVMLMRLCLVNNETVLLFRLTQAGRALHSSINTTWYQCTHATKEWDNSYAKWDMHQDIKPIEMGLSDSY